MKASRCKINTYSGFSYINGKNTEGGQFSTIPLSFFRFSGTRYPIPQITL
jgi:hypothetical protein